jgi:hypothetical protein
MLLQSTDGQIHRVRLPSFDLFGRFCGVFLVNGHPLEDKTELQHGSTRNRDVAAIGLQN